MVFSSTIYNYAKKPNYVALSIKLKIVYSSKEVKKCWLAALYAIIGFFFNCVFEVVWLTQNFAAINWQILFPFYGSIIARSIHFLYGKGLIFDLSDKNDKTSLGEDKKLNKGEKIDNNISDQFFQDSNSSYIKNQTLSLMCCFSSLSGIRFVNFFMLSKNLLTHSSFSKLRWYAIYGRRLQKCGIIVWIQDRN